jgi:hypothetical protein
VAPDLQILFQNIQEHGELKGKVINLIEYGSSCCPQKYASVMLYT